MRRLAFRALLALAVLAAGHTWVTLDKTVAVDVDGQIRSVRTFASTVAEVLDRAGVAVGVHDAVVPDPGTRLGDGDRVVVRRGRPLELVVNGRKSTVWVTALSVAEALDQLHVRADQRAFLSASRSRGIPLGGMAMEVRLPARVRVVADGSSRVITTTAATVREVLAAAALTLAPTDVVSAPLSSYPADNSTVRVTRVRGRTLTETTVIPRAVQRKPDPTMVMGATRVIEPGLDGLVVTRFALTVVDGKVTHRKLMSRKTTRAAKTRVVAYGTKDPRTQACKATWYRRSGMGAAHRTLPKGTTVRVVNLATGKSISVVIDDRGPYGPPDYCLDLSEEAFKQLAPLGAGVFNARLYW